MVEGNQEGSKSYIQKRYMTLIFDDLEADDLLAMLQDLDATFILSQDKDLKQVVGWHLDRETNSLTYTSEEDAIRMISFQMLTGDTVDNIPGLKGVGPDKASKLLDDIEGVPQLFACLKAYIDKYGAIQGMDTFNEMWGLLAMRTGRGNYTQEKYRKAFDLIKNLKDYVRPRLD